MRRARAVLLTLSVACGGTRQAEAPAPPPGPPAPPQVADSLALQAPAGITVWFTSAREARDSAGAACLERALEIRQGTTRRGVPLLYTREAPTLLDKDAMRAVLYNGCRAGPAYRVDFATVSPKRLPK